MLSIRRISRGLRTNRLGSVAFEFALITPLLLGMLIGTLEYGFVFFSYNSMQLGADYGARQVSVNTSAAAAIATEVKSKLPTWLQPAVNVTITQTDLVDARKNLIRVRVTANAADATPINFFTKTIPWTLATEVAVVQELPF
jgi:Flp pilus assembly protein TadG